MLPTKIRLTDEAIESIKTARTAKRIPAATLSKAINRDASYISSLELGRLRSVSSADLIALLCNLYGITEQEAAAKAEELISTNKKTSYSALTAVDRNQPASGMMTGEKKRLYGRRVDFTEPELISDMLDEMTQLIIDVYNEDPKEAVFALKSFVQTLRFDRDFVMNIMEMPFYSLNTLSISEREAVISEMQELLRKHAGTANATL